MLSPKAVLEGYACFIAKRYGSNGHRVLEIGAGTGFLAARLATLGFEVWGVEPSKGARDVARVEYGIDLLPYVELLPQHATCEGFDCVVAIEVIEHLRDPWGALRKWRGYLSNGGGLFVTTPNRRGARAMLKGGAWREARKPYHLFLFGPRGLRSAALQSGYSRVKMIRDAPLTCSNLGRKCVHKVLQLCDLYGGLRMAAY